MTAALLACLLAVALMAALLAVLSAVALVAAVLAHTRSTDP